MTTKRGLLGRIGLVVSLVLTVSAMLMALPARASIAESAQPTFSGATDSFRYAGRVEHSGNEVQDKSIEVMVETPFWSLAW